MYKGKTNLAIRQYFYLQNGVTVLNDFRNLFLGIFALYFAMKLDNVLWIPAMFVVCLPILIVVGYINVHKISKVKEWLSVKFGTHYGIKQFDYTKKQTRLLEKILDNLNDNTRNHKKKGVTKKKRNTHNKKEHHNALPSVGVVMRKKSL